MVKSRISVAQISDGLQIECCRCHKIMTREGVVYFSILTVENNIQYYDYWCIESFLWHHSEDKVRK